MCRNRLVSLRNLLVSVRVRAIDAIPRLPRPSPSAGGEGAAGSAERRQAACRQGRGGGASRAGGSQHARAARAAGGAAPTGGPPAGGAGGRDGLQAGRGRGALRGAAPSCSRRRSKLQGGGSGREAACGRQRTPTRRGVRACRSHAPGRWQGQVARRHGPQRLRGFPRGFLFRGFCEPQGLARPRSAACVRDAPHDGVGPRTCRISAHERLAEFGPKPTSCGAARAPHRRSG